METTNTSILEYLAAHGVTVRYASTGAIKMGGGIAFVSEKSDGRVVIKHQNNWGSSYQRFKNRERALAEIQRADKVAAKLAAAVRS